MDIFFVVWISTTIIGLLAEFSFILDVCKETINSGFKINKKEVHKLMLPPSILFLPIFNIPFITAKEVKYLLYPLWENLSEIKSDNIILPLTYEEQKEYKKNPTNITTIKITLK